MISQIILSKFFLMGSFETCRISFGILGLNLFPLRLLWCCCVPSSPGSPILGEAQPLAQDCGMAATSPWQPCFMEKQTTQCQTSKKFSKKIILPGKKKTTACKLGIYVLTFDFLLLKHTLGFHLASAQLLVVYTGYWLFTLGQYTGQAVYTRPATNSTAHSVSSTAAFSMCRAGKK